MKKARIFAWSLIAWLALPVSPALAQYPPSPGGGQTPAEPGAQGGLPFTGANVSVGLVLTAVLIVAGVALIWMARRRRVRSGW